MLQRIGLPNKAKRIADMMVKTATVAKDGVWAMLELRHGECGAARKITSVGMESSYSGRGSGVRLWGGTTRASPPTHLEGVGRRGRIQIDLHEAQSVSRRRSGSGRTSTAERPDLRRRRVFGGGDRSEQGSEKAIRTSGKTAGAACPPLVAYGGRSADRKRTV